MYMRTCAVLHILDCMYVHAYMCCTAHAGCHLLPFPTEQEEEQAKIREEEEKNWEKALSGVLSGRRRAAIGAAQNVSEVAKTTKLVGLSVYNEPVYKDHSRNQVI